jgi:DNA-directed RNA polymerase specialized sigma24 family protein
MKSSLDQQTREELENADWKEIWPRLLLYATHKVRKAERFGGRNHDPQDLVQEAVSLAFGARDDGRFRHWNKHKYPELADFLMGVISSLLYHEVGKDQKNRQESLNPDVEKKVDSCHIETMANYMSIALSPEEALEQEESCRHLINKLEEALADDKEAQLVLLAGLVDGAMKPQDIAEETGIAIDRVYKARGRIRRIWSRIS